MKPAAERLFGDLGPWQAMLDRHRELFAEMLPGSRIGIVPRSCAGAPAGKRIAGLAAARFHAPEGRMLAWEVGDDGMRARFSACNSFAEARADLLLVADDFALARIEESLHADALAAMKRMIRTGNILFFVMKSRHELQDAGYEDFLDSLGLAFLGACR